MIELLKGEMPEKDKLIVLIQKKIGNKKNTLEDIKDVICAHITEHKELDDQDDFDKAESTAFHVVNKLIDDLEVNITNYKKLKSTYHPITLTMVSIV